MQSRYYDPETARFLNADSYASTGQGVLGNNMFAYCGNNPAVNYDPTGTERISFHNQEFGGHSGSDGGGGVGVTVLWEFERLLEKGKEALVNLGSLLIVLKAARIFEPDNGEYFVYVLVDNDKNIQYVGRTKDLKTREDAHKKNPYRADFTFKIVLSNLTYFQARGLEQILMLYCHTIDKENKKII